MSISQNLNCNELYESFVGIYINAFKNILEKRDYKGIKNCWMIAKILGKAI